MSRYRTCRSTTTYTRGGDPVISGHLWFVEGFDSTLRHPWISSRVVVSYVHRCYNYPDDLKQTNGKRVTPLPEEQGSTRVDPSDTPSSSDKTKGEINRWGLPKELGVQKTEKGRQVPRESLWGQVYLNKSVTKTGKKTSCVRNWRRVHGRTIRKVLEEKVFTLPYFTFPYFITSYLNLYTLT